MHVPGSGHLLLIPERLPQPLLAALISPLLVGAGPSALPGWPGFQLPIAAGTSLAGAAYRVCARCAGFWLASAPTAQLCLSLSRVEVVPGQRQLEHTPPCSNRDRPRYTLVAESFTSRASSCMQSVLVVFCGLSIVSGAKNVAILQYHWIGSLQEVLQYKVTVLSATSYLLILEPSNVSQAFARYSIITRMWNKHFICSTKIYRF